VRNREYAAVERTLDFDEALRREQSYQHSGNVDDGQVIKLGKQFGAGLVCVADASEKNREYLFTARLINIETGLVISFSSISVVQRKKSDCGEKEYCDCIDHDYGSGMQGHRRTVHDKRFDGDRIKQEAVVTITDNLTTELLQNVITVAGKQKLAVYVTR
jgi:hypothetical protein